MTQCSKIAPHRSFPSEHLLDCCRDAAGHIIERSYKLMDILAKLPPNVAVNIDDLLLRESMDIIGRTGFQKEMGALEGWLAGSGEGHGSYIPVSTCPLASVGFLCQSLYLHTAALFWVLRHCENVGWAGDAAVH